MASKLNIAYRAIDSLKPYKRNARTHSDVQVEQIAASIKEFGWTNPILIDGEGVVVAGHGRLLAAQRLNMKEVPVVELSHLTKTQRKALVLADNKLALNAGWDFELLKVEIGELDTDGFNLELLGFGVDELNNILELDGVKPAASPDEGGDAYVEQYGVIVVCNNAAHQERVYTELLEKGYEVKVVST